MAREIRTQMFRIAEGEWITLALELLNDPGFVDYGLGDDGCRFPRSLSNPSGIDVQWPCRTAIHASSWTSIRRERRYSGGQCS
jgi:hypothetical protein